jgi:hypothetical protein
LPVTSDWPFAEHARCPQQELFGFGIHGAPGRAARFRDGPRRRGAAFSRVPRPPDGSPEEDCQLCGPTCPRHWSGLVRPSLPPAAAHPIASARPPVQSRPLAPPTRLAAGTSPSTAWGATHRTRQAGVPLSRRMDLRSRSQGKASVRRAKVGSAAALVFAVLFAVPVHAWGAELSLTSVTGSIPAPPPPIPQTTTPSLAPPPAPDPETLPPPPVPTATTELSKTTTELSKTTTELSRTTTEASKTTTFPKTTTNTPSASSGATGSSTQPAGSSAASASGAGGRGSAPAPPASGPVSKGRALAPAAHASPASRRVSQLADARAPGKSVGTTIGLKGLPSGQPTLSGLRLADAFAAVESPGHQEPRSQQSSGQWVPWPSGASLRGILAAAGSSLPAILVLVAAALIVGLLFADELGWGPRHAAWRARYLRRPPRY